LSHIISSIEKLALRKLTKQNVDLDSKAGKARTLRNLKKILDLEIDFLMKKNNLVNPPFDLRNIREIGKAKIKYEYLPRSQVGADGCLDTNSNGFVIKIDRRLKESNRYQFRMRSTLAHELSHVFFYDVNVLPPKKLGRESSRHHFLMEEGLCYYLAREYLMPKFSINNLLFTEQSKSVPSIENLKYLKSKYLVSSDIIAFRMISDLEVWDCIFIKFLQEGTYFKSKTKLKSKSNPFYKKLKIPKYLPCRGSANEWLTKLHKHLIAAKKNNMFQELIKLDNHFLALESEIDTFDPFSIVTISYEELST
jgi:Zn-dependent peptidase ImmA (M78 family)